MHAYRALAGGQHSSFPTLCRVQMIHAEGGSRVTACRLDEDTAFRASHLMRQQRRILSAFSRCCATTCRLRTSTAHAFPWCARSTWFRVGERRLDLARSPGLHEKTRKYDAGSREGGRAKWSGEGGGAFPHDFVDVCSRLRQFLKRSHSSLTEQFEYGRVSYIMDKRWRSSTRRPGRCIAAGGASAAE